MQTAVASYDHGMQRLVASWAEYARGATGAAVRYFSGVAVAVFPAHPEREFYDNALLDRGLTAMGYADAVDAVECAYGAADIDRYAVWVHEGDTSAVRHLELRDYVPETTTRAMGMNLDDIRLPRPTIDLATPDWDSYVRIIGLAPDYLRHADRDAYHVLIARCGLESVSTAMAFDCGDDCGIFNVGTLDGYRRRGFGTALTVTQLYDARARGCRTASLQSTLMAERIYAAVGFRDHGRFLEYVPTS